MADRDTAPRWREDFPITWDRDHYVTRRELAKFLTLGSALLVAANAGLVAAARLLVPKGEGVRRIGTVDQLPVGGSLLFTYPTAEDPCILVRPAADRLVAYSQVCTHLSCAVIHEPGSDRLYCPCHHGVFSVAEGEPVAGPPTRRLPRIRLEERGGAIWATGLEV
jgi:Rieske Fe-S protein